jgi:probable non-F420 flavinoid oxidoreductase
VKAAQQAGFGGVLSSDHFHPWSDAQGESGFAWSWLGAAMAGTSIPFGIVHAPGQRYHPAISAQAVATILEMYPDRFWVAVGSGQALNEHITGDHWPEKSQRNARLLESVEVMRRLWSGEIVSHHGLVRVEEAKLFTVPRSWPKVIAAAITEATAEWAGTWADGLITVSQPDDLHHRVAEAFWRGGGSGKPVVLKAQISYARDESTARRGAHEQWRNNVFKSETLSDLRMPSQFDGAGQFVQEDEMDAFVRISADLKRHIAWISHDLAFGFDEIYLHNVNNVQHEFIEDFGKSVLPEFPGQ